ncbi:MAG: M20/M25/M40 family metallo-hydrolase [Planctomycetota bacterium]
MAMLYASGYSVLRGKGRFIFLASLAPIFLGAVGLRLVFGGGEEVAAGEQRLAATTFYLSSDKLEGRGFGTKGIDLAADYIADQLRQLNRYGMKTDLWSGSPFQKFKVAIDADLGPNNSMALVGPPMGKNGKPRRIELVLGKDYTPLAISGNGKFDLPLAFAGYGITVRSKANYDDFAEVDVAGKATIMLRHQPRDAVDDKESAPIKETACTSFRHKVSNACEHGAAAVIFCSDQAEVRRRRGKDDALLSFHVAGTTFTRPDVAVINFRQAVIDNMLRDLNEPALGKIEEEIDRTLKPASRELKGWRIQGETDVRHVPCEVKNVAAVLPGEGPLANEVIVLGAHYDHLGYGSRSTLPSKRGAIYPGADDNASGVAVVLEVARALAQRPRKLRRTVVFILFTGEEWGFWGSSHYVNDPVVPMSETVAMINLDMVGRLREDALTVNSVGTGTGFSGLLDQANRLYGFHLTKVAGASGRSDQASFYAKRIPNLHFFTGKHPDYHRPTDTFSGVNISGMWRIANYVLDMTVALADAPQRPDFVAVPMQRRAGDMPQPFFGCIPDFTREEAGYPIGAVIAGSPAERCGLRGGDVIVKFGKHYIGIGDDFDDALQKYAAADRVKIKVRRKNSTMTFEATLAAPQ